MRLDELKDSLTRLADEVATDDPQSRLAGVDRKIVSTRRQRQWSVVGAAAALVLVAVAAPSLVADETGSRPTPPASDREGVVTEKGVDFYAHAAGSTLIGHLVTNQGDRTGRMVVTPQTLDLSWVAECYLAIPEDEVDQKRLVWLDLQVNGKDVSSQSCGGSAEDGEPLDGTGFFGGSNAPAANERGWARLGVDAGEPATVSVVVRGDRELVGDAQVAVAIFERETYTRRAGVWLPERVMHFGTEYEFAAIRIEDFDGTPTRVDESLVDHDGRTLVRVGMVRSDDADGVTVRATDDAWYQLTAGSSFDTVPKEGREQMRLRIGMQKTSDVTGTVFVAQYRPVS